MKAIYKVNGKAAKYSPFACDLYNGCPHECSYCHNNHSSMSKTLGGKTVRLKKQLVDEDTAYEIFCKELARYRSEIISSGSPLHFSFVSDPCLSETIELNWKCIDYTISQGVPVQVLTKRADWLFHPAVQNALCHKDLIKVGFSLTGCDALEPGASPNAERISAINFLHFAGISTWASIEPIIDPHRSLCMIARTVNCCDHYKVGILSGKKKYSPQQIRDFMDVVKSFDFLSVYCKNSTIKCSKKITWI
ncbi:hypothetical protein DW060_07390 [Leyella stercorea]|uniref:Radical SAM protein n=1 Tax=Leyella stercorea TaxID=363265 RepID=A0A3R6FK44_9BACT|nr:hypothetical protein DW060_07390 [Leyella stercorea]